MICELAATKFCKDDISKIENYEAAIADTTQTWHCHHRDEVKVIPSGMTVIRSAADLIENDRYYNCPANELIFLTSTEHARLHNQHRSAETRAKISAANKGKHRSNETKAKMSANHAVISGDKNPARRPEVRAKISAASSGEKNGMYGKKHSDASRVKISAAIKAYWECKRAEKETSK